MKIKHAHSQTFQANKILTSQRILKKSGPETIELFKLNHVEDTAFAKKCNAILSKSFSRNLDAAQKGLKRFFNDFLNNTSVDKDYFLSIKNNEIITGGMISLPFNKKVLLQYIFSRQPKDINTNTLFYGLITDTQDNYKGYSIATFDWLKNYKIKNAELLPADMNITKTNIKNKNPETTYNLRNDEIYDLDDILGTKDFETEIWY